MFKKINIRSFEVGLKFRDGEFASLIGSGKRFIFARFGKIQVQIVSKRDPWIVNEQLDMIVQSGKLAGQAEVVDLRDHQRALVWIDGRFDRILGPGLYAYWNDLRQVSVEVVTVDDARLDHKDLRLIVRTTRSLDFLDVCQVERDHVGVCFVNGRFTGELDPGLYAFWKGAGETRVVCIDRRENQVDVCGQEMLTADKVTLRVNALATYIVRDARRAVSVSDDVRQSLYREVQLALRDTIGNRKLDEFLSGQVGNSKELLIDELEAKLRDRAEQLGLEVVSVGI